MPSFHENRSMKTLRGGHSRSPRHWAPFETTFKRRVIFGHAFTDFVRFFNGYATYHTAASRPAESAAAWEPYRYPQAT